MSDISDIALRFRADLLAREERARREMRRAWADVRERLLVEIRDIETSIRRARTRGVEPLNLLARERRLVTLAALVDEQISRFAGTAERLSAAHAEAAATIAAGDARRMIDWATPPGLGADTIRLPADAVEQIVARTASPQFTALFDDVRRTGREVARHIAGELRAGLALGENPRRVARRMREVAGLTGDTSALPLWRAERIARTEAMQAYRDASRATYAANPEVVRGWVWIAALDRRTCGSCIAQHGSEHSADEAMDTHPNCRCVAAPWVRPWREMGFDAAREPDPVEPGGRWLMRQPERTQVAVLGRGKARALRSRRIAVEDLVAERHDPLWGRSTSEASLAAARRNAERRRFLRRAA